jgi:hypothetical protein
MKGVGVNNQEKEHEHTVVVNMDVTIISVAKSSNVKVC